MADYPDPDTWFNNSPAVKARLDVVSYENQAAMGVGDMVEYIDHNLHGYGRDILSKLKGTSLVGGNEMSLGEFAAWADKYLFDLTNTVIPTTVNSRPPGPYFDAVLHKSTGVVYGFRVGDRPLLWKIRDTDEYWFYQSLRLLPPPGQMIKAENNLMDALVAYLKRFAALGPDGKPDWSGIEPVEPPPPPKTYTVGKGDTLGKISAATGISVADLVKWNNLANPDVITEGQVLKLEP